MEAVTRDRSLQSLATDAFRSSIRAYAAYPAAVKNIFHVKKLHIGHVAHSFALRRDPSLYLCMPVCWCGSLVAQINSGMDILWQGALRRQVVREMMREILQNFGLVPEAKGLGGQNIEALCVLFTPVRRPGVLQGGALDLWQVCSQRGAETPEDGSACREGREAQQAEVNAPRCEMPWSTHANVLKRQWQPMCRACVS